MDTTSQAPPSGQVAVYFSERKPNADRADTEIKEGDDLAPDRHACTRAKGACAQAWGSAHEAISRAATMHEEPDEALLQRLQAGEQAALSELWGRYAPLLYSQSLKILHNPSECEDVVAEAFSEVWQRSSSYHAQRARPAAWLVTLIRRRAIDRLRERRSLERAEERLMTEFARREPADTTDERLRLADLRWLLEQALDKLNEKQQQTIRMIYFQGLTQKEIADRTHTPIGTIKTRLELALKKMRERIRGSRLKAMLPPSSKQTDPGGERSCGQEPAAAEHLKSRSGGLAAS
ncbi:MAG: sigma-70 family RNA polymerase sigma factor [Verrucomicrobiota bacterium]